MINSPQINLKSIVFLLISLSSICYAQKYDFSSITEQLKDNMKLFDGRISYLIQKKDGTILAKEHLSDSTHTPYSDDSNIHVASGCKWPAMTTIMKLVEDGKLSLEDKVTKFYQNNEFSGKASSMTLQNLMSHTSGFGYFDKWCESLDITLQESAIGIGKGGTIQGSQVPPSTIYNDPGTKVLYGDIGMQVAGAIAEKVSGKSFPDMFKEYLGDPLGMVNAKWTSFDGEDGKNVAIADGLKIRMQDYANFMIMLMNGGTFKGKQIIKQSTVQAILKDYTSNLPVDPQNKDWATDGKLSFGLGTWIFEDGNIFSSNGVYKFYNYFDVENEYLGIFYVKTDLDKDDETDDLFDDLRDQIRDIINKNTSQINKYTLILLLLFIMII